MIYIIIKYVLTVKQKNDTHTRNTFSLKVSILTQSQHKNKNVYPKKILIK